MLQGQGFMMTDEGIVPMNPDGTSAVGLSGNAAEMTAGGAALAAAKTLKIEPEYRRSPPVQIPPAQITSPDPALKPVNLIRQAKARAKEIRKELKALSKLQKELEELERLIAAAKQKPVAIVRNIRHG